MSEHDQRPPLGVAHVVLETDRIEESARFMRTIGMRPIFQGSEVCVFELRGGTHLILMLKNQIAAGDAPFDLMVDDLHATHRQFASLGFPHHRSKPGQLLIMRYLPSANQPDIRSRSSQAMYPVNQYEAGARSCKENTLIPH